MAIISKKALTKKLGIQQTPPSQNPAFTKLEQSITTDPKEAQTKGVGDMEHDLPTFSAPPPPSKCSEQLLYQAERLLMQLETSSRNPEYGMQLKRQFFGASDPNLAEKDDATVKKFIEFIKTAPARASQTIDPAMFGIVSDTKKNTPVETKPVDNRGSQPSPGNMLDNLPRW